MAFYAVDRQEADFNLKKDFRATPPTVCQAGAPYRGMLYP